MICLIPVIDWTIPLAIFGPLFSRRFRISITSDKFVTPNMFHEVVIFHHLQEVTISNEVFGS